MTKTVLITGGARRLGRAMAVALAADGYGLYLHYHSSAAEAASLVAEIEAGGGRAAAVQANLVEARQAAGLLQQCTALGPVTCLINNAASYEADDIADLTAEKFDRQMALNLRAPLLLAQSFAAQLPAGERGAIVNMLDFRVAVLPGRLLTYTLAKAGLNAATEMLALMLAPAIRVNGIAPGLVLPGAQEADGDFAQRHSQTLLEHGVASNDIVAALRYLLSAEAVTGQVIMVDAGQRLISQRLLKSKS